MTIPWVSAQIGLNGKFFVPRILHQNRRLAATIVPLWYDKSSLVYKLLQKMYWNAPNYYHPDLEATPVFSMLANKLWFELSHIRKRKELAAWELIDKSNRSYQSGLIRTLKSKAFLSLLKGQKGIFISWSDISLEGIRHFQSLGWKTVTMQLNCGELEEELIALECRRYPEMQEKSFRAVPGFNERTLQEYRETDHIISNSSWGMKFLLSKGIPADKISLVPFAFEGNCDRQFERTYPTEFNEKRPLQVLHVGQMSLRKGIGRFFEAIGRARNLPIEFTFAGSINVPIPPEILNNSKVRIQGVVPLQEIQRLYLESDVFLFPTLSDAFGLTQLECMAWKLPLIASRHCGDVVKPNINGLLLDQVTADSILDALTHCLSHPENLQLFSQKCSIPQECSFEFFGKSLVAIESMLYPALTENTRNVAIRR